MSKEQVRRKAVEDDEEEYEQQREEEKLRQKSIENKGEDISLPPLRRDDKQDVDW